MLCGWERNRRSGVALAMRHKWSIHLRAHGLRKGDEHPAYTPVGVCDTLYPVLTLVLHYNVVACVTSCVSVDVDVFCMLLYVMSVSANPYLRQPRDHARKSFKGIMYELVFL